MRALRIGTRGSPLALWQARAVSAAIDASGGPPCEPVVIKTTGDRMAAAALSTIGGKRLFVKEIEDALLAGAVDVAVHSAKDLPADLPPGLTIAAALPRAEPRDAIAVPAGWGGPRTSDPEMLIAAAGDAARIGTGSVRRVAQLTRAFPSARFEQIRGNVETRLRKLDEGGYDLVVLAAAGLTRLGLEDRIAATFSFDQCMPAPGQGIVAIETRTTDTATRAVVADAGDPQAMVALQAERALVIGLGGGCQVPIGAVASPEADQITLQAIVASLDGSRLLRRQAEGPADEAGRIGHAVAEQLIDDGAAEILAEHA